MTVKPEHGKNITTQSASTGRADSLILGIDSATPVASAALADEKGLLGEISLNVGLTHSEQLLPMIDDLLRQCRRKAADITAIGVSSGPGSFTGLRIGMATAKALAQGLSAVSLRAGGERVEMIAVPTLEAMARQAAGKQLLVSPMLYARREQIYTGLYRWRRPPGAGGYGGTSGGDENRGARSVSSDPARVNGGGQPQTPARRGKKERLPAGMGGGGWVLECLIPPEAADPENWGARLDETDESICLLGDGAAMYEEIWIRTLGEKAVILPPLLGLCRGSFVALAAYQKLDEYGSHGNRDFYQTKPIYLRGI